MSMEEEMKKFVVENVAPVALRNDLEKRFPLETIMELGKKGYMGLSITMGTERDLLKMIELLAEECPSTALILASHLSLCTIPIFKYGTDYLKDKYLKDLTSGKKLGAFALSEPTAGSDALSATTTARKSGNTYIINGHKSFITNVMYADVYLVFAYTNEEKKSRGMTCFVVEKSTPGLEEFHTEEKMGLNASTMGYLRFTEMVVDGKNILGNLDEGYKLAMQILDLGRLGVAAQGIGLSQGAFNRALTFVKKRQQFDQTILSFQHTQMKLAEMTVELAASKGLLENALKQVEANVRYTTEASIAKLHSSKTAVYITNNALQLMGGYGYMKKHDIERFYRDAKALEIYEGTSEIQKIIIASQYLRK